MVIYDQSVVSTYNGDHQARIDHIIATSNIALSDSNVAMALRQVKSTQIDTSDNIEGIETKAAAASDQYAELNSLRETNGADLVAVVTAGDLTTCGLAGLGGDEKEGFMNASTFVSVSSTIFDGCDDMTVLHEIGHNMGLGHSAAQNEVGTFIWSRGYGENDRFHTIMAYDTAFGDEPQLMQFLSNPDISTCLGSPCGLALSESQPANAAMSMNVVRFQIASYQPTVVSSDGTSDADSSGSDGGGAASSADTDGDGIPNVFETILGSDPAVADADNDGDSNQQEFDALPKAIQYLQTTSSSNNVSRIHIVNTSSQSQPFTGTLYNGEGTQLGSANLNLSSSTVAAKGRLNLTSADLETIFGVDAWSGPAMLEVKGGIRLN